MNTTMTVTYAATAAFDAVDMTRVRAAAARCTRVPQEALWMPGNTTVVATPRKRLERNQHIFMIQSGALGAGASGPSPWGCPV